MDTTGKYSRGAPSLDVDNNDQRNLDQYFIHGHKRIVSAIGLALVLFISALDSTIGQSQVFVRLPTYTYVPLSVGVDLPVIGDSFDDYRQASCVVTSYLLTYTGTAHRILCDHS